MISKESSECFVYIILPRETKSVTAGKFVLTKDRRGNAQGRFVYGDKYLLQPDAVEIDPIELKLAKRTYETVRMCFNALISNLDDHPRNHSLIAMDQE